MYIYICMHSESAPGTGALKPGTCPQGMIMLMLTLQAGV